MAPVPSRPPPYSIGCSSFPPPIEAAAGPQAWAFQRAFENAREPVRWAILTTMRCWKDEWRYYGQEVPRQWIQHAYHEAPADMKVALDYIADNNIPFSMWNDRDRRRDQLFRTGRVEEVETTALLHSEFMSMYSAASESVQEEILTTIRLWTSIEEHHIIPAVPRHECAQAYAAASDRLKVVVSWMLETGYNIAVWNQRAFEEAKLNFLEAYQAQVTAHIELHAMNKINGTLHSTHYSSYSVPVSANGTVSATTVTHNIASVPALAPARASPHAQQIATVSTRPVPNSTERERDAVLWLEVCQERMELEQLNLKVAEKDVEVAEKMVEVAEKTAKMKQRDVEDAKRDLMKAYAVLREDGMVGGVDGPSGQRLRHKQLEADVAALEAEGAASKVVAAKEKVEVAQRTFKDAERDFKEACALRMEEGMAIDGTAGPVGYMAAQPMSVDVARMDPGATSDAEATTIPVTVIDAINEQPGAFATVFEGMAEDLGIERDVYLQDPAIVMIAALHAVKMQKDKEQVAPNHQTRVALTVSGPSRPHG
ncbi:hypothetical protein PENSPDRAFT_689371 [Peniophora sp. CONT]|nr:hypothetical protein PENSPDRAFT_689371 [Peniophora sp. CONT]